MKNSQKSGSKIKIMPLGDRVLVRPKRVEEKEKTASGIYLPSSGEKERPAEGTVVAVGDGSKLKVGDKIIFSKYSYEEINVEGEDFYILKDENIFAIIK
jgi:chaperonin GroES